MPCYNTQTTHITVNITVEHCLQAVAHRGGAQPAGSGSPCGSTACRQWLTVCKDDANGSIGTERAGGEREVVLGGYQSAVAKVQVK